MALRSQLSVWAYTPPSNQYPLIVTDYGEVVEALEITTVAPGGFGDLACLVKLPEARLPRPELQLFSRVCVRDGLSTIFGGEWADPALVLDSATGDHLLLSALGGGVALRDDPDDSAYTGQTAKSIISSEFAKRAAYLAVDADQSLILPGTPPATTFSPLYDGYNLEEVLHDLAQALGDYTWGVWDHATHADAAGFPTWQVQMHARDLATTGYVAYAEDVAGWRVQPSQQRAYNVVQVAYVDPTGGPGTVTVSDPRLNGDGSQGAAPFRRRKLRRNLGRSPLTSAQASAIAQAWLAGYQNVTNKVEVELRAIRDANGQPVPLHMVRADRNLFVPELAVRGQTLTGGPVAGVNQFYIVETVYRERANGDVSLVLHLDNYADRAASTLAQLKLSYDAALRARGVYRPVLSPGAPLTGDCGGTAANALAGGTCKAWIAFPGQFANVPSVSIAVTSSSNASGVGAQDVKRTGFNLTWTSPAAGASTVLGTYTAQGQQERPMPVQNSANTLGVLQALQGIILNEALVSGASPFAALNASDQARYGVARAVFVGRPKDFSSAYMPQCCLFIPEGDEALQPVELVSYAGRVFDTVEIVVQAFVDLSPDWYAAEKSVLQIRDTLWPALLHHELLGGTVPTVVESEAREGRGLCFEEVAGSQYRCYEAIVEVRQQYLISGGRAI